LDRFMTLKILLLRWTPIRNQVVTGVFSIPMGLAPSIGVTLKLTSRCL